ncbi:hypothetical protein FDECE_14855 [Fusarium decemcellulare]|nr:hypothetical protein FDECE_14855 [Fusarium decemcellulare]
MNEILSYQIETWAEYGFCTLLMFLRMISRIRVRGLKGLDGDDYLIPVAFVILTVMSVAAVHVSTDGHNKVPGVGPESNPIRLTIVQEDPETAEHLARGSKFFLVGWLTYPGFVWTLKLCMMFLLKRLTKGLYMARFIKPMMALIVTCYVIIVIVVCTYCRPFHKYWQVYPDPGTKCYPDTSGLYVAVLTMNLITDTLIVIIPLPVIFQARMPILKKLGMMLLLSAGVFIMVAAILRVYMSFTSKSGAAPAFWACREATVACFVVNAPPLVPMFRKSFWQKGPIDSSSYSNSRSGPSGHIPLSDRANSRFRPTNGLDTYIGRDQTVIDVESSSTEHINRPDNAIRVKKDVVIDSTSWDGDERDMKAQAVQDKWQRSS